MKRVWQIFVLFLAISSLLAPASLSCLPLSQPDHSCCSSETQLSAPSCCQPGVPHKSAMPTQANDQANGALVLLPLPDGGKIVQPISFQSHVSVAPPILLPATILRT